MKSCETIFSQNLTLKNVKNYGGRLLQYEITERIPLLDKQGNLTRAGYAKRFLPVYDHKR